MISSPWFLLLVGAAGASVTMIGVWLVSIRIANASYVDVAWALGIAGTAVAYALLAEGSTLHRVLVAGLGTIWGVRLGTYLLARLAGKEEDGRYQELRRRWAPHVEPLVLRLLPGAGRRSSSSSRCRSPSSPPIEGEMTWLAWAGAALALGVDRRRDDGRHAARRLEGRSRATRARRPATASGAGRATRTTSSSGCTGSPGP